LHVLHGHEDEQEGSVLGIRLMGAVHRVVLRGDAPDLAAQYPSAGGTPDEPWPAFLGVLTEHARELRERLQDPVQTNEPLRCAALLGGFLEVSHATGLPLRLLEVGASAGLNLRFDRYRYELGGRSWGPTGSRLTLSAPLDGEPRLDADVAIASRSGCDPRPVDPTTAEGRLTLASYVWADQVERLERLRGACAIAVDVDAALERSRAGPWLTRQLQTPVPGAATVVFHSIVMQYLSTEERADCEAVIRAAGKRATDTAPLAWLRLEPDGWEHAAVRLTTWPGGQERLLARAGFHGAPVEWLV